MKPKLPHDVIQAIEKAKRTPGWNNRRGDVRRFELVNLYGREPCLLYVVPARRWAYQRWDKLRAERMREYRQPQGGAA